MRTLWDVLSKMKLVLVLRTYIFPVMAKRTLIDECDILEHWICWIVDPHFFQYLPQLFIGVKVSWIDWIERKDFKIAISGFPVFLQTFE